ncbi:MAG: 4Fe-4S binding protein [Planctomycetota bacterium]
MSTMLSRVIKNLFSKPATRKYPFEVRPPLDGARGKLTFDQAKCDQCGDCQRVCPAGAIEVNEKEKNLTYDPFRCVYCWVCAESCLQGAIKTEGLHHAPAYAKGKEVFKSDKK